MALNAREIGLDATVNELRKLLVERFKVASNPDEIPPDAPLFEAGVGLSSVDGVDLLLEVERRFGIQFGDFDEWLSESPSVTSFARYLVEKSTPATP